MTDIDCISEVKMTRDEILWRFRDNLSRSKNLVEIYNHIARPGQGRQPVETVDVLRAATVFLHAALEEVFRNIALWKYPSASEAVLNEIPLAGTTEHGRAEKFFLGKLANHRSMTVQKLIDTSVEEFIGYFTINNTTDVSTFLRKVGVNIEAVSGEFPTLNKLFTRRHRIVHQADRQQTPGQGNHRAQGLNQGTVYSWIGSVERFVTTVLNQIPE